MYKRLVITLTAILILFSCLPAFAQDKDAANKLAMQKNRFEERVYREFGVRLYVHETAHWLIATDCLEEEVKSCGKELEKCYRLYFKLMKDIMDAKERPEERMCAFIFKTVGPRRAYYSASAAAIFVTLYSSRGYRTLFHEATHQLQFECSSGRTPTWLVEGLAMYFESYVEIAEGRAEKVKGIVPMYFGGLKERAREGKHIKVSELVSYSYKQFHGKHERLNYCESGALVHFLLFGKNGAYQEKLKDFIQGKGSDDLYSHLGLEKDRLEREFLAYIPGLINYADKINAMFKDYYNIATGDFESAEFHICVARILRLKGEFDEARKELDKAAEKDKEGKFKSTIKYNEGVTLYYESKWSEARKVLEKVSKQITDNPQLFYFLACACEELKDSTAAEKYYEKSVAIEPNFFSARYELALLYLNRNKTKKAIKHLEACTKLKPIQWTKFSDIGLNFVVSNVREVLAIAYIQDGQYVKAIETLKEYVEQDPTATGYYHLAVAYAKNKNKNEAIAALGKAFKLLKHETIRAGRLMPNMRVLNAIADLYVALGEEEMAISVLEMVKEARVIDIETRATMAKLYARQGKIDKALEEVGEIIKMKPATASQLEDIAITLKNLKKYKAAEKVYGNALEIEPKNQYLLFNFGVLYWAEKKYAQALQMWEKALAIDPDFAQAKKWADKARKKLTGN